MTRPPDASDDRDVEAWRADYRRLRQRMTEDPAYAQQMRQYWREKYYRLRRRMADDPAYAERVRRNWRMKAKRRYQRLKGKG